MKEAFLKRFIREEKTRRPIGVAVLIDCENPPLLGYSLCAPNDQFDKKLGTAIALARATSGKSCFPDVDSRQKLVTIAWDQLKSDLTEKQNVND
jgi:hypothetical protein